MNLTKKIILFCGILLLSACAEYKTDKSKEAKEKYKECNGENTYIYNMKKVIKGVMND